MSSTPALIADLPTEVAIQIAGHLAAASVRPMDEPRALWGTYCFMRRMCRDPEVSQCILVERLADDMAWYDPDGYAALLGRLALVGNPEACFITGMHVVFRGPLIRPLPLLDENLERAARGSHKVVAYVATVLLYMANGSAGISDTARQYMTQAVAVEESVAAPAGSGGTMLSNEQCYKGRRRAVDVIWRGRWRWPLKHVAPAPMRAYLPCASENCGAFVRLEWPKFGCRFFYSEDCWIRNQAILGDNFRVN
ncbi:hypothetical protein C2845_PM12G13350 [Panicum miliaceum]|uniref:Uncharacterized protein n=1 Tax=Panicum miliaceum TaxID=4540 RepID=A0A3L6QFK2_PANMI|nr:hypothetical protein C2845_PM12G13350 [Panicum miliaceum]